MKKTIVIEGMHCNRCAERLQLELSEIDGLKSAKVSFKNKKAVINYKGLFPKDVIEKVVEKTGYTAIIEPDKNES